MLISRLRLPWRLSDREGLSALKYFSPSRPFGMPLLTGGHLKGKRSLSGSVYLMMALWQPAHTRLSGLKHHPVWMRSWLDIWGMFGGETGFCSDVKHKLLDEAEEPEKLDLYCSTQYCYYWRLLPYLMLLQTQKLSFHLGRCSNIFSGSTFWVDPSIMLVECHQQQVGLVWDGILAPVGYGAPAIKLWWRPAVVRHGYRNHVAGFLCRFPQDNWNSCLHF